MHRYMVARRLLVTIEQLNAIYLYHEMILPKMLDAPWAVGLTSDISMGGVAVRPSMPEDFPPEAKVTGAIYILEVTFVDSAKTVALWRVALPYPAAMPYAEVCATLAEQCTGGIADLTSGRYFDGEVSWD